MDFSSRYYGAGISTLNYRLDGAIGVGLTKQMLGDRVRDSGGGMGQLTKQVLGDWKQVEGVGNVEGGSSSPCGFCDRDDEIISRSDTPSSTSSSLSTNSEEEDESLMEEMSAASKYLEQIREQALKLLNDMEVEQSTMDIQRQQSQRMNSNHRQSQNHRNGQRDNNINNNSSSRSGGRGKKRGSHGHPQKSSQSSKHRNSRSEYRSSDSKQMDDVYLNLQSQSHDIMETARQTLASIQTDSYTQYAQKKIRAALKQPRREIQTQQQQQQQYYMSQQQRRQEQLLMLQRQYQQQRRQLRRARKLSRSSKYNRASTFSGSLSPIPEVHTDGGSQYE